MDVVELERGGAHGVSERVSTRPLRMVFLTTVPESPHSLMRGQLGWFRSTGAQVTVICSPGWEIPEVVEREGVEVRAVPMTRRISPVADAISLVRVMRELHRLQPARVCAGTPKAGLLGMLAARLLATPVRVYTLRGLRLETSRGIRRHLLGAMEWLAASCAQRVVAVSPSLRDVALASGYFPAEKLCVLGSGSSNGVDAQRFQRSPEVLARSEALRQRLGIRQGEPVVGFVGRLVADKGLADLMAAYDRLAETHPHAWIVFAGAETAEIDVAQWVRSRERGRMLGRITDTAAVYGLIDVLAFPSHREGFPNVPLEAACMEVPAVAARATGTVDAVAHGETGLMVDVGDVDELAAGLRSYLEDPDLRMRHGKAARQRALTQFSQQQVWQEWRTLFNSMLQRAGKPQLGAATVTQAPVAESSDGVSEQATQAAVPRTRRGDVLKRAFDVGASSLLLIVLCPLMAVVALMVRWRLGSPVLYRQQRPGRHGKPFTIYKFRSMLNTPGSDEQRLTRFGKFLRATSLDELPELWNVLRGEMSLVGPRPLMMEYLPLYSKEQARRHEVRPGITGIAQVNGRNSLTWDEKLRLDVWYVDNRSFWLDLKILLRTIWAVLVPKGISSDGHATMPRFQGAKES